jgi:hypothetical protein
MLLSKEKKKATKKENKVQQRRFSLVRAMLFLKRVGKRFNSVSQ